MKTMKSYTYTLGTFVKVGDKIDILPSEELVGKTLEGGRKLKVKVEVVK